MILIKFLTINYISDYIEFFLEMAKNMELN